MKTLLTLIGLVLLFEGLPYATFPEAMQKWLQQIQKASPMILRLFGLLAMACGLLLCYVTQRTTLFN